MKKSILRNMFMAYMAFGIAMGVVFPYFADLFVSVNPGMQTGFVFACLGAGVVMGIATFLLMRVMLVKPLMRLSEATQAVGRKDLRSTISLQSQDVIGEIVDSFNMMSRNLKDVVSEMESSCKAIHDTSNLVHTGSNNASTGAGKQSSRLREVRQLVEKIRQEMSEIRLYSERTAASSIAAQDSVKQTMADLQASQSLLLELVRRHGIAAEAIATLNLETDRIDTAIDLIQDISEQTNMLALNAAVEAARAGRYGAGFAVVAKEVRALASKAQLATIQIREIIAELKSETRITHNHVDAGQAHAQNTVTALERSMATMKNVVSEMGTIAENAVAIDGSMRVQSNHIETLTQKTDAVSRIAAYHLRYAHDSAEQASWLQQQSRHLHSMFSDFRMQREEPPPVPGENREMVEPGE